ncbi:MAG: hypothetical protein WCV67_02095 [Victivallaceae bacterium]|jgi:hypothetical protein
MRKRKYLILLSVFLAALSGNVIHALPSSDSSDVKQSKITSTNENVTTEARNGSNVNTGIQIKGSTIRNATIDNKFSGNIRADNSTVNTGIKADGAVIDKAKINVDTRANINADNADVNTGVNLSGARNAEVTTKVRAGEINASNSTVKVGAVEGDVSNKKIGTDVTVGNVDAMGRNYSIGSVKSDDYGGIGNSSRGTGGERPGVSIGNVNVEAPQVREVKTSVGSDDFIEGIKIQHKAKVYKDQGGVDPAGTKNVFVSAKERAKVEEKGGSAGDTTVSGGDYKVKKVKTFVE